MQIKWTSDEKHRLANAVYYYLKQNPSKSVLQAINSVQDNVLLPFRCRIIVSRQSIPWIDEELDKLKSKEHNEAINLELSKIPFEKIVSELINRFDIKMQDYLLNIEKNIENKVIDRINNLENKIMRADTPALPSTAKPYVSNAKKRKVIIVGLLNNQFNEIKKDYKTLIDLKLWNTDSSIPKLKSMITYADNVIMLTNFVSHEVDNIIKITTKNFTRVTGGLSTIREELNKFI